MRCALCGEPAWYRCARTGVSICARHAQVEVVAAMEGEWRQQVPVREAEPKDRERLEELALHFWGETEVECFDSVYDVLQLPALVAEMGSEVAGFLSYAVEHERVNLVMLNVLPEYQGRGRGEALLEEAIESARRNGLKRVIVATSNDDLPALGFYQRRGFVITEVVPGRILEHHGGEEEGFAGIPVRDEMRLELSLGNGGEDDVVLESG
jgi:ribosomal protein S18 acetylase RimI-like enzyme